MNLFEVKVRFDKMHENGISKKVTELYLFDALTFTEAEARATEKLAPFISGDFSLSAVKRTKIAEIINQEGNGDKYYLFKVGFVTIDERTAIEKRSISHLLVKADNFKDAISLFDESMKGSMADYEIVAVNETMIIDVYLINDNRDGE